MRKWHLGLMLPRSGEEQALLPVLAIFSKSLKTQSQVLALERSLTALKASDAQVRFPRKLIGTSPKSAHLLPYTISS